MSMPVNNMRTMFFSSLPLLLLIVLTSIVIWQLTKSTPFSTGRRLAVHQALQNLPSTDMDKRLAELLPQDMFAGRDPFFRNSAPQPATSSKVTGTDKAEATADLQEIHLSTIAQGTSGRYCLINGNIFNEGRRGNGFTVKAIEAGLVVFSTPVQTFSLQPGQKVTLEKGKILNREEKTKKAGINRETATSNSQNH